MIVTSRYRSRSVSVFALASAGAVLMSGCTAEDPGARGDSDTYTHVLPAHVLHEWDPALMYEGEPLVLSNVYETLTYYDPESEEVEPRLAEDWEVSGDGEEWTFELNDDVTFHSGEPLTATAVQEAIERTMELEGGAAYLWDAVESIEAPSEDTVVFELAYAAPLDLITSAAYGAFIYEIPDDVPEDPFDEEQAEQSPFHGQGWGTGPYEIDEFNPGDEMEAILESHEDYWRGWDGDEFQQVQYQVVPEESTAAQLLESGEVDSAQTLSSQIIDSVANEDHLEVLEEDSLQNLFALFNTAGGPLADEQVREAVMHGINYSELIEATEGSLSTSEGVVPDGPFGSDTDNQLPQYDPERAEELMEEAGYDLDSDIVQLELTYNEGEPDQATVAELIQSHLSSINIEVEVSGLPYETGQMAMAQEEDPEDRQDIFLWWWWPDNAEANAWYSAMFHSEEEPTMNLSYYSNPDMDELIAEVSEQTATDEDAAQDIYAEMESYIIDDAVAAPLGEVQYRRVVRSDVENFVDNPLYAETIFPYEMSRS